jgi:hypothetical protein
MELLLTEKLKIGCELNSVTKKEKSSRRFSRMNAEPATGKDTEKAGKTKYKQEPEFKV